MRQGDTFISRQDIGGAILERVINAGGERYSLILVDGVELYNCPTDDEARMLEWFKGLRP